MEKQQDALITLKPEFIKDYFFLNDQKIVILENKAFKNIDETLLILAKVNENEKEIVLEPLTEDEYALAVRKYEALLVLIDEEDNHEENWRNKK